MTAPVYDFGIEQGVHTTRTLTLVQVDEVTLTTETIDGTAKLQCRPSAESKEVYFTLTELDGITLDDVNKQIVMDFPDELTSTLSFDEGVYDLYWYPANGIDRRVLQGTITLGKRVTRK